MSSIFKNVMKGLGTSAMDAGQSLMPNLTRGVKENKSFTVNTYNKIKENSRENDIRDQYLYKSSKMMIENAIKDIKSGNINNKTREKKADDGFGFGDLDFNLDDMNFDFELDSTGGDTVVGSSDTPDNNTFVVDGGGDTVTLDDDTKDMFGTMTKISAVGLQTNNRGFATLSSQLRNISKFNNENTLTFYQTVEEKLNSMDGNLGLMGAYLTDIQVQSRRNRKGVGSGSKTIMDAFNTTGIGIQDWKDLYSKENSGGGTLDLVKMMFKGDFEKAKMNPLGFLTTNAMKMALPKNIKNSIGDFDKMIGLAPLLMQGKFQQMSKQKGIMGMLGKALELKKPKISSKKFSYEKGQIGFDGVTKRAVTHAIPGLLGRILTAISSDDKDKGLVYNYESGKFTDQTSARQAIQKNIKDETRRNMEIYDDQQSIPELRKQIIEEYTKKGLIKDDNDFQDYSNKIEETVMKMAKQGKMFNSVTDLKEISDDEDFAKSMLDTYNSMTQDMKISMSESMANGYMSYHQKLKEMQDNDLYQMTRDFAHTTPDNKEIKRFNKDTAANKILDNVEGLEGKIKNETAKNIFGRVMDFGRKSTGNQRHEGMEKMLGKVYSWALDGKEKNDNSTIDFNTIKDTLKNISDINMASFTNTMSNVQDSKAASFGKRIFKNIKTGNFKGNMSLMTSRINASRANRRADRRANREPIDIDFEGNNIVEVNNSPNTKSKAEEKTKKDNNDSYIYKEESKEETTEETNNVIPLFGNREMDTQEPEPVVIQFETPEEVTNAIIEGNEEVNNNIIDFNEQVKNRRGEEVAIIEELNNPESSEKAGMFSKIKSAVVNTFGFNKKVKDSDMEDVNKKPMEVFVTGGKLDFIKDIAEIDKPKEVSNTDKQQEILETERDANSDAIKNAFTVDDNSTGKASILDPVISAAGGTGGSGGFISNMVSEVIGNKLGGIGFKNLFKGGIGKGIAGIGKGILGKGAGLMSSMGTKLALGAGGVGGTGMMGAIGGAGAKALGALGSGAGAIGKAGAGALSMGAKGAGALGGTLGGVLGGAAKFLGPIGLGIGAVTSLMSGKKGWDNAGDNFNKMPGEKATFGEKASSAVGGVLSSLSLGLLDEKRMANGIHGVGSKIGNIGKGIVGGVGKVGSSLLKYSPIGLLGNALFGKKDKDGKEQSGEEGDNKSSKKSILSSMMMASPIGLLGKSLFGKKDKEGTVDLDNPDSKEENKKSPIKSMMSTMMMGSSMALLGGMGFKKFFGKDKEDKDSNKKDEENLSEREKREKDDNPDTPINQINENIGLLGKTLKGRTFKKIFGSRGLFSSMADGVVQAAKKAGKGISGFFAGIFGGENKNNGGSGGSGIGSGGTTGGASGSVTLDSSYSTGWLTDNDSITNKSLRIQTEMTGEQLKSAMLAMRPSNNPLAEHADLIVKAGKQYGVDPLYLAAHAAEETGWGTSKINKDKNNWFGIGAFDNDPYNKAYSWATPEEGIMAGAKWISENYINSSKYNQDTLKKMRYNNGVHEYATNDTWHTNIASIMKSLGTKNGGKGVWGGNVGVNGGSSGGGTATGTVKSIMDNFQGIVGTRYQLTSSQGPDGYDCSGSIQYAYEKAGYDIPPLTWSQVKTGRVIGSVAEAQPGDLMFSNDVGHVTMYAGNGKVYASDSKTGPVLRNVLRSGRFADGNAGIRRYIDGNGNILPEARDVRRIQSGQKPGRSRNKLPVFGGGMSRSTPNSSPGPQGTHGISTGEAASSRRQFKTAMIEKQETMFNSEKNSMLLQAKETLESIDKNGKTTNALLENLIEIAKMFSTKGPSIEPLNMSMESVSLFKGR